MKYAFESRVRFSEVDENQRLSLYHVINYLQDCSTFQGEDTGVGVAHNMAMDCAWILADWQIHIDRYPALGEKIIVKTWAYGYRGPIGFRNYSIETEDGEVFVRANADWVFMNTKQGIPVRIPQEQMDAYHVYPEEKLQDDFGGRKMDEPEGGTILEPFEIQEAHLDTNHHVNNGKYVQMMQNCLPRDFRPHKFRAVYKKSAVFGDVIYPVVLEENGKYLVKLQNEQGETYFVGEAE